MTNNEKVLTFNDFANDVFSPFNNDKMRIKYMSEAYKKMSISKAFSVFYNKEINNDQKSNQLVNTITKIELGQIYLGYVKVFSKNQILFEIPGVKEEIISKENFSGSENAIQNYLLTHDNKLLFEVREKKNNKYYVSVVNAYYKVWINNINKAVQTENPIEVHIDDLVINQFGKGGYICHTNIEPLIQLTGKNYTHSVFIPGSHIVLNIERDFKRWIGSTVSIIPQKIVEFYKNLKTGEIENSIVGSRKRVLQIQGMQNIYEIYRNFMLSQKEDANIIMPDFTGTVTGIINSNGKTGIFVELNDKYITGLANVEAYDILDYKPGDQVKVKIKEFETQEGKEPFIFNKKNKLVKSNVRPVFELI